MTVAEMLSRIDSHEIGEWQAFEMAFGPIGREYPDNLLAEILEQMQILNRMTGSQFEDNPAPMPKRVPRPPDFWGDDDAAVEDEGMSVAEFDGEFD